MKRLGRKGHPTYRVVVQDSRQSPSSGKYIALLGSYDPHTKQSTLVKEKAEFYLKNGAQPSDRVIALFQNEKVKLPKWVKLPSKKEKSIRNPEKLRKNRPADAADPQQSENPDESSTQPDENVAETTESEEPKATTTDTQTDQPATEAAEESSEEPDAEKKA